MDRYNHPGSVMNGWPIARRTDTFSRGLIEAFCPHGVGHPIPESIDHLDKHGPPGAQGSWGVHGCDGCCYEKEERNE